MKLIKSEKKDYTKNKYLGYFVAISYTLCLSVIRFLDYIEKFVQNRDFLATIAMLAVISIIFLNFTICYASNPNTKLLEEINDFDMGTNNNRLVYSVSRCTNIGNSLYPQNAKLSNSTFCKDFITFLL